MAAYGHQWNPPLPQGWEARYDHNQKAYFYINHATKSTSWVDPRFPPANSAASAAVSLGSRGGQGDGTRGAVAMHEMSAQAHTGGNTQEESSMMNRERAALAEKIRKDYPGCDTDIIGEVLRLVEDDERQARAQLADIGFTPVKSSSRGETFWVNFDNEESTPAPTPKKTVEPPKPREVSAAEKQRATAQLKREFPDLDSDLILMCLDTCKFNVEEGKTLMKAWQNSRSGTESSRPSASTEHSQHASSISTPTVMPDYGSLDAPGLEDDFSLNPQGMSSGYADFSVPSGQPSPSQSPPKAPTPKATTSRPTADVGAANHQARQVTKRTKPKKKSPTKVVVSQPGPAQVTPSDYRTESKGPDSSLRRGPDASLLISEYSLANGPDQSLRRGPNPDLLSSEYTRANGPNPGLRCGPQESLLAGGRGPAGVSSLLVSNI